MHEDGHGWFDSINAFLATMAGWLGLAGALALGLWRWIIRGGRFALLLCRGVSFIVGFAARRCDAGHTALVDELEEIKAAQLEIRLRLANVEEQLGVGTFAADAESNVRWWSPYAVRLLGKDSTELLGKQWFAAIADESRDRIESLWNLANRQRAPASCAVVTEAGRQLRMELWPSVGEGEQVVAIYGRLTEAKR